MEQIVVLKIEMPSKTLDFVFDFYQLTYLPPCPWYDRDIEIDSPCGRTMSGSDISEERTLAMLVERTDAASIESLLRENNFINPQFKIKEYEDKIAIPIKPNSETHIETYDYSLVELPMSKKSSIKSPQQKMQNRVKSWLTEQQIFTNHDELLDDLPNKWEKLGSIALIPQYSLENKHWQNVLEQTSQVEISTLWKTIAESIGVKSLGRQQEISNNQMRTSQVILLHGDSGICEFTDHGVTFALDVTEVMFSSGNVTERHRIGDIDMTGEVVVDAFAGIGYYTLPMLVRSNAKHVYAIEINPNSVKWLEAAAKKNDVQKRLTILRGDNSEIMQDLHNIADRVHLGILPSSKSAWKNAARCLKPEGGFIHIHMNCKEEEIADLAADILCEFETICRELNMDWELSIHHIEKVKWYAPRIRHVVIDLQCR